MRILFVCTGNTCRSPMAEVLLRAALAERPLSGISVASAGVSAFSGMPASNGACRAMRARGLSLDTHSAQALTQELLEGADLVLAMTTGHVEALRKRYPDSPVEALLPFAGVLGESVSDPFGGDDALYEKTARQLETAIRALLPRLEQMLRECEQIAQESTLQDELNP